MGSTRRFAARAVIVAAVAAASLYLTTGCGGTSSSSDTASKPQPAPVSASPTSSPGSRPAVVLLPGGHSAKLMPQTLTDDEELPVPENLSEAAWWGAGLGASEGTTLLTGHVNWKGRKGPFEDIHHVTKGQKVKVVDTNGKEWVYTISEINDIPKEELPAQADRLFSRTGPHRLVLVTCSGDFVGGVTGYRNNRVVIATL